MKLAVIGKDVSRSDSPKMHGFLLRELGVGDFSYDRVSVPEAEFDCRIEALFATYDAFNVTIPYKTRILPYLKEIRGDARTFGAVNTVLSASREGFNTDGYGFLLMLKNAGVEVKGKSVLVLGAGGAGRSCIKKLIDAGANVCAYEKFTDRLQSVHREFSSFTPLETVPLRKYDLILNCTGIGMHNTVGRTPEIRTEEGEAPVDERLLSLTDTAVDLIYVPKQSEFLRIAAGLHKRTVNGEAMLFYQAYCADCIYLGREPSAEEAEALFAKYREEEK